MPRLSEAVENKIRTQLDAIAVLDPSVLLNRETGKWAIVDRSTDRVIADGFEHRADAVFHARAREYVDQLLAEVEGLREQLNSDLIHLQDFLDDEAVPE